MGWFSAIDGGCVISRPWVALDSGYPLTVNRYVVRVYFVALEVEKQVVYKLLLIPIAEKRREQFERHLI